MIDSFPLSAGVYCIRNTITDERYVGQSKNIRARLRQHISDLNTGWHCNPDLQKSWKAHGEQAFAYSVLELLEDDTARIQGEKHYISEMKKSHKVFNKIEPKNSGLKMPKRIATGTYLFRLTDVDERNRKTVEAYVRKQLGIKVPFRDILSALLMEAAEQAKKAN